MVCCPSTLWSPQAAADQLVCNRPLWISPRQVVVYPDAAPHKVYAIKVQQDLWEAGFYADVDLSDSTLSKEIRSGETAQ